MNTFDDLMKLKDLVILVVPVVILFIGTIMLGFGLKMEDTKKIFTGLFMEFCGGYATVFMLVFRH